MQLRPYASRDVAELTRLFYDTVHTVNAKDYIPAQLDAWADGAPDLAAWNRSLLAHDTLVAWDGGRILGFADLDGTGYLDRLYVHAAHQGQGIGSALCTALEGRSPAYPITTHASITAMPFFAKRGYHTVKEQTVLRKGLPLINFVMCLAHPSKA